MIERAGDGVNSKQRINGTESTPDFAMKLTGGNPGALSVMVTLLKGEWHGISGFMMALYLDSLGIYNEHIWMLYKDCCGEDIHMVERVLRAWQTGHTPRMVILDMVETGKRFENLPTVEELLEAMRARNQTLAGD